MTKSAVSSPIARCPGSVISEWGSAPVNNNRNELGKQAGITALSRESSAPINVVRAPPPEHPAAPILNGSASGRLRR